MQHSMIHEWVSTATTDEQASHQEEVPKRVERDEEDVKITGFPSGLTLDSLTWYRFSLSPPE